MAITGPHQGGLWCCWFQELQAHCGADPCIWEGMGGPEGAVRHVRPENWTGSHHSHKQGLWHCGRDAAAIWPCDLGQATSLGLPQPSRL